MPDVMDLATTRLIDRRPIWREALGGPDEARRRLAKGARDKSP
jgi:hypothetical protein